MSVLSMLFLLPVNKFVVIICFLVQSLLWKVQLFIIFHV